MEILESSPTESNETENNSSGTVNTWRLGPLAIAELDELQSVFDFANFKSLSNSLLRPMQIRKISRALKVFLIHSLSSFPLFFVFLYF